MAYILTSPKSMWFQWSVSNPHMDFQFQVWLMYHDLNLRWYFIVYTLKDSQTDQGQSLILPLNQIQISSYFPCEQIYIFFSEPGRMSGELMS